MDLRLTGKRVLMTVGAGGGQGIARLIENPLAA